MKVEKGRVGLNYKMFTKISALLRVVLPPGSLKKRIILAFQRCSNLHAQEQWTGLACLRQR